MLRILLRCLHRLYVRKIFVENWVLKEILTSHIKGQILKYRIRTIVF